MRYFWLKSDGRTVEELTPDEYGRFTVVGRHRPAKLMVATKSRVCFNLFHGGDWESVTVPQRQLRKVLELLEA